MFRARRRIRVLDTVNGGMNRAVCGTPINCSSRFTTTYLNRNPRFERFRSRSVSERIEGPGFARAAEGAQVSRPLAAALPIPIGMEIDRGRVTKNGYGVSIMSCRPRIIRNGRGMMRMRSPRAGTEKDARRAVRYLIWAGMGGSSRTRRLQRGWGCCSAGRACTCSIPPILRNSKFDSRRHEAVANEPDRALAPAHAGGGMAMGMTSYEPVVNLEKLAGLYDSSQSSGRNSFI